MSITKVVLIFTGFFALAYGAYFARGWYEDWQISRDYEKSVAPIRKMYEDAVAYQKRLEEDIARQNKIMAADHYGGATPEETLALFVEALKKRDAKLAAKYYVPWKQKEAEEKMIDWMDDESLQWFIDAYENGTSKRDTSYVIGIAMNVYPKGDKHSYIIKMEFNKQNNIWKIIEF